MRMRLIDAESLKELFPDNGEGSWTYNTTVKAYIDAQPTIQPDTTTHDSIPAKTGKNDGDGTSGDCTSRTQAIEALRDYLVGKRCPDDGTLTCRLIENEVINKLPSAQPERKTGRWIPDNTDYYRTKFICSACGESEEVPTTGFGYGTMWDYCPMCGAKMEGGEQECLTESCGNSDLSARRNL